MAPYVYNMNEFVMVISAISCMSTMERTFVDGGHASIMLHVLIAYVIIFRCHGPAMHLVHQRRRSAGDDVVASQSRLAHENPNEWPTV